MYCKECGEVLTNDKAVICLKCGTNRGQGSNYCPECGVKLKTSEAEICLNCGVRVNGNFSIFNNKVKDGVINNKCNNKTVAAVLAIFLGALGIHRFYLGYKEVGFIQLSLFIVGILIFPPILLGSCVWATVDVVNIFLGKLSNANVIELI